MSPARAPEVELSVVVPAFNEERRIGATLEAVGAWLAEERLAAEVLVVDDGSADATSAVVEGQRARIPALRLVRTESNHGKGFAVRCGFLAASGDLVLFTDADNSTPIGELSKLRERMNAAAADAAIGSRALPDSDVRVRQGVLRQAMGRTFNNLVRALAGTPFKDTQCGFKLFRRREFQPVFEAQRLHGFAFDVEILVIASRLGLRVVEVPVTWINSPESRVHVVRDSLRMLRDLLRIRWNAVSGRYPRAPR